MVFYCVIAWHVIKFCLLRAHSGADPVNESISPTHGYLLVHYGPLLTLKHVAEVMHSTPNSIRMALRRKREPFARALALARKRLGRRIYFDAGRIATLIDDDTELTESLNPATSADDE